MFHNGAKNKERAGIGIYAENHKKTMDAPRQNTFSRDTPIGMDKNAIYNLQNPYQSMMNKNIHVLFVIVLEAV